MCDGMPGVDHSAPAAEFCFPTSSQGSWPDAVHLSELGGQAPADAGSHRGTMWKKRPLYRALKKGQRLPPLILPQLWFIPHPQGPLSVFGVPPH